MQDYRIILSYDMTAWGSDNTPVFKSPDDFDSIEIKTRSCGDVGQRPYCWLGDSPSQCTTPQENRPCLWKSTIVYASHDFGRETCIDIPHDCDNRNFFQVRNLFSNIEYVVFFVCFSNYVDTFKKTLQ